MATSRQRGLETLSRSSVLLEEESALYASLLANGPSQRDNGAGPSASSSSSSAWRELPLARDRDFAAQIAREESIAAARFDADRALAQSLADDTETHRSATTRIFQPAAAAVQVPRRTIAAPQPQFPPPRQPNAGNTNSTNASSASGSGWLASLASWLFSSPSTTTTATTTITTTRPAVVQKRLTGHNCVACQDAIRGDEVQAPCSHYYDKECILSLFDAATRDESLFPPRCCRQPIPLYSVQGLMTTTVIAEYNEKSREFQTLKRVYCSNATCSRFLGPQLESVGWFARQFLNCPAAKCNTITCARCKAGVVPINMFNHQCNLDQDDQAVLALGRRSGWARCPGCSQLVELNLGCFHMTCLCKTQFCYVCQARWKTCTCPQWDENRLLLAAEARVDARFGAAPIAARAQPPLAARVVQAPVAAAAVPRAAAPVAPRRLQLLPVAQAQNTTPTGWRAVVDPWLAGLEEHDRLERRPVPPTPARGTTASVPQPTPPAAQRASTVTVGRLWDGDYANPSSSSSSAAGSSSAAINPTRPPLISTSNSASASSSSSPSGSRARGRNNTTSPTTPLVNKLTDASFRARERARLVAEEVKRLRVDHDCQHTRWVYRQGGGNCESCHQRLPMYLFRCNGCQMLACNRCRRNRL